MPSKKHIVISALFLAAISLRTPEALAVRNGPPTDHRRFPSVVKIHKQGQSGFVDGTGILIRPDIVLTAAHVVKNWTPGMIDKYVMWNGKRFPIAAVTIHPDFKTRDIDLAVVKLARPILASVSGFYNGKLASGQILAIAGFGRNGDASKPNEGLGAFRRGEVTLQEYADKSGGRYPDSEMIMSRGPDGTIACEGDSGGPAFVDDKIAGVFFGYKWRGDKKNECQGTFENAYISTSAFKDWVEQAADKMEAANS